jgi:hypothetical protein
MSERSTSKNTTTSQTESDPFENKQMNSIESTNYSSEHLTPSAEASALIQKDYLQSLHNKLTYARPTPEQVDFLLSEICRIEDELSITGPLTTNLMYQPTPESLESLEARKKEVMNKIINGSHLDALSMQALQNQLADIRKKITEAEKEVKSE